MAGNTNTSIRDDYVESLIQQLAEYELLESMYPDPGDIVLTDKDIISSINLFIDNKSEYIPNHLDFKMNIRLESLKLEIFINLPSSYPKEEPDIYIRCNQMNRYNESSLNNELSKYIRDNHTGEVCLYTAISWLQENFNKFTTLQKESSLADISDKMPSNNDEFTRLWIYSHHIYNKRKREEIVKKARELELTGFCLPGKPGIVCVEGSDRECKEWWKDIKSMTWKKIMVRKTEIFHKEEETTYKKFSNFEELIFKNSTNNKTANMSELSKYMKERGLSAVFNEIFGLCSDD